ncbi:MAG TPA: phage tail protein [Longimicrobium sp.]|jgi:phage tail-like protein|nr:phage tail protein [Longimicrobium sp.]
MSTLRPFALVDGGDAWARASHGSTFLDHANGVVELAWSALPYAPSVGPPTAAPGGMAFDAECRLYHADPAEGTVTRTLWRAGGPLLPEASQPVPVELLDPGAAPPAGDFAPVGPAGGPLLDPRGVAVDVDDRLFVAERGAARILVFDLWSGRLLRAVPTPAGTRPLDLAADGRQVYAALEGAPRLLRLTARGTPSLVDLPPEALVVTRLAASPSGGVALLVGAGGPDATVVLKDDPHHPLAVPFAGDLEWEDDEVLCVARRPGECFRRFRLEPDAVEEVLPRNARGYDGGGIVRTPDGTIGYWTAGGFLTAPLSRVRYATRGTVLTWRLDAGEYQAQWGRIFLDACIPAQAGVRAWCATADETFDEPEVPRDPPANLTRLVVRRPDLSPPLPPRSLVPDPVPFAPLHRRETGRELAWVQPAHGDAFVTYEAPVPAPPGRFLWVMLELTGNSRVTPRVRSLRVERHAHDLLRRLPRTFSRESADADFLRRFLALCDGMVDELEGRAALRQVLLDPFGTPEDMLPWLAGFLGLALDGRWPVAARRTLVAEAAWLFRFRGTLPGLSRFLEIYLGTPPVILEDYRMRGMGGVGGEGPGESTSVLGGGFRVGGRVGEPGSEPLSGAAADAFALHAHRFTVLVRGALNAEQLAVVRDVLDLHRPAHTLVELCAVDAGMRVGRGLHLGITSAIGRTGGFRTLQLGAAALGRGAILGRPVPGTRPGGSRLGLGSRVG